MKKKILLTFPSNLTGSPVTYNLIKNYDLKINILRAEIKYNVEGELLLELEGTAENIESGIGYLEEIGITVEPLGSKILWHENDCIHCGACTAVCHSQALSISPLQWTVSFDEDKCLGCQLCVKACPVRAVEGNI